MIIATTRRSAEVAELIRRLGRQTLAPERVIVVGADPSDLPPADGGAVPTVRVVSPRRGLTRQRNAGLRIVRETGELEAGGLVAFFDDDFRPADDWLETAAAAFAARPDLAGLTGRVLADGVNSGPISEDEAEAYLAGSTPARPHWSATGEREVESLYGCNMALAGRVAAVCDFDEALPAYGWQEDCDYAGQARRFGRTLLLPACRGVHLGSASGRVSGLRMGYSQIANPIRIAGRGNMSRLRMARFLGKALAANLVKSARLPGRIDYRGRLRGNLLALLDLVRGRCRPERIEAL